MYKRIIMKIDKNINKNIINLLNNKLLLILFIFKNINNVSAGIIETPDIEYKLDLVGLLITFGDESAKNRLLHQIFNRDKWIFVCTVTPGIYTWLEVLNKFYQNSKNEINIEEYSTNKYKYLGLFSNTNMKIQSIAGENFIKYNVRNPNDKYKWIKNIKRDIRRLTNIRIIELKEKNEYKHNENIKQPIVEWWWFIYTIITFILCIITGLMEDWFAFSIIMSHIMCNIMIHILLLNGQIFWMQTKSSEDSPDGDCFIETNNSLLYIKGKEDIIQKLLQRPIIYKNNTKPIFILLLWLITLLTLCWTVLGAPLSTTQGQYILGASLIVGLIANIHINSENNGKTWNEICNNYFNIDEIFEETFESRGTALSIMVLKMKINPKILLNNNILPNTNDWNKWANILEDILENNHNIDDSIPSSHFIYDAYSALEYINFENKMKEKEDKNIEIEEVESLQIKNN